MVCVAACRKPTKAEQAALAEKPRVDATALFVKFECTRCHEIPNVAPAPRDKHCVQCHQQIHDGTFELGSDEVKERWKGHIHSIRWVPSLAAADRLRADWIRDFLLHPHDVRPDLEAEMPRLDITRDEATQIAAQLTQNAESSTAAAATESSNISRGEDLFRNFACGRCHRFTGARADNPPLTETTGRALPLLAVASPDDLVSDAPRYMPVGSETPEQRIAANTVMGSWALAPDLRFARDRMTTEAIAAWIAAPRGAMPSQHVKPDDANDLAAFIANTPLEPTSVTTNGRLPLLAREVAWDEVEQRVFKKVCWHCHATADYAMGDGGPGDTGGFGFRAHDLDLSTYEAISSGATGDDGKIHSVFQKLPDGTPLLVAHLIARHTEEAGGIVAGVRGMPLGLPPISWEDIQLVDTWIAQGRQR
jgi:cytochrome c2